MKYLHENNKAYFTFFQGAGRAKNKGIDKHTARVNKRSGGMVFSPCTTGKFLKKKPATLKTLPASYQKKVVI